MGNTCWIPKIVDKCRFEVGILPQVREKDGALQVAANLNVISSSTPYPEECLSILNYLAESKPQQLLAKNGRPVANIKANKSLEIKGFDKKATDETMQSFANGRVIQSADPYIEEYIRTIINAEMQKWQKKESSDEELIASLKRKTSFFYRSKSLTINNFGANENETGVAI